jgi:hypothetical protein
MAWKRVEIGNPFRRGSSVGDEFMKLCHEHGPQMFKYVWEIITNKDEFGSVRLNAIKFLRETSHGKPRQAIELTVDQEIPPEDMTTEQLRLAAAAQTKDLVYSLLDSGKLDEYIRGYERVVPRIEKDITEVKDDHLGDSNSLQAVDKPKPKAKPRGKK